jgi:hypothetical protein
MQPQHKQHRGFDSASMCQHRQIAGLGLPSMCSIAALGLLMCMYQSTTRAVHVSELVLS